MDTLAFKRITLSKTGSAAFTREYEVMKTLTGMKASLYEGSWNFGGPSRLASRTASASWSRAEYEELCAKLHTLGVQKWNGFSKSNPNVLDGESFSLDIELTDGSTITAYGCNAYPENYQEVYKLLNNAVDKKSK